MTEEKPRLGPWLRRYGQREEKSRRERVHELLLAGAAAVGFLVVLIGVLVAFVAYPIITLVGLVALWGIGFVVLLIKRRRAATREHEMHAHAGLWDKRSR